MSGNDDQDAYDRTAPYTDIADPEQRREIARVLDYLDEHERVKIVTRQSRILPGGSPCTPNIILATDRKVIIRNPTMLGLRENIEYYPYDSITMVKLGQGRFSSKIVITAPGMATTSRPGPGESWQQDDDGIIHAIPRNAAREIVRLIRTGKKK